MTSEESLRTDVVQRSLSVVVIVSFWSPQVPASVQINTTLETLADEFAGRFLLAKLDVVAQPQLAQALGIPQVPLVVAALRGQLAPLIQEPLPEAETRELMRQVLDAAAANGVTGTADRVRAPGADPEAEPEAEPVKHVAAEEALLSGDLDAAIAGYERALAAAPGDEEATVGLARAQLLKRTQGVDVAQARPRRRTDRATSRRKCSQPTSTSSADTSRTPSLGSSTSYAGRPDRSEKPRAGI